MSFLNGLSALGSGLTAAGTDIGKEEDARQTLEDRRASLLNNAPPPVPAAAAPTPTMPELPAPTTRDMGNKLDAKTIERAHLVYTGLTERGMDRASAVAFAANAVQESRADPATNPGDMGASHQLMQWRGPRWDAFVAQHGKSASLDDALDHIMYEIRGPEARAWAKIQATAADPAARAGAVSQYFERPKDTAAEIDRRGYIANQLVNHFARLATGGAA